MSWYGSVWVRRGWMSIGKRKRLLQDTFTNTDPGNLAASSSKTGAILYKKIAQIEYMPSFDVCVTISYLARNTPLGREIYDNSLAFCLCRIFFPVFVTFKSVDVSLEHWFRLGCAVFNFFFSFLSAKVAWKCSLEPFPNRNLRGRSAQNKKKELATTTGE